MKPSPDTLRVAVIGGGPSAMFFCHALETQMREAQTFPPQTRNTGNNNNINKLSLLQVTCFEKAATPGGVWKAVATQPSTTNDQHQHHHHNPIYQELWTNSIGYNMEFYDYSFDEHFDGKTIPMYLPRQDVNEYLLNRVTRHCPTFFQKYFEFGVEVVRVAWTRHPQQQQQQQQEQEETVSVFEVTIRNIHTGESSVRYFDKCIWAAGMNGMSSIPSSLRHKIDAAAATNKHATTPLTLLHSSETDTIRQVVRGKRVVLIGGGLSAEDLALQCLKWGAVHLDVVARANDPEVSWTTRWPWDRVTVHLERAVKSINQDGSIHLERVEFKWPFEYQPVSPKGKVVTLHDVNIVIFCTGYQPNLSMLDATLKPESGYLPTVNMGQHPSMFLQDSSSNPTIDWKTWKMKSDHDVHRFTGHVAAGQGRMIHGFDNHPDIYRGIFLPNPNMMYLSDESSEIPLLALDVKAWLLCSYLTGRLAMPSVQQLRQSSQEQLLEQLHFPSVRYCLDEKYCQILDKKAPNRFWERGYEKEESKFAKYELCLLNRIMEEGRYPGLPLATKNMTLNPHGKQFYGFAQSEYYSRANIAKAMKKQKNWGLTFRDDVEELQDVFSLYTGKGVRPLKKPWMDIIGPCSIKHGDI